MEDTLLKRILTAVLVSPVTISAFLTVFWSEAEAAPASGPRCESIFSATASAQTPRPASLARPMGPQEFSLVLARLLDQAVPLRWEGLNAQLPSPEGGPSWTVRFFAEDMTAPIAQPKVIRTDHERILEIPGGTRLNSQQTKALLREWLAGHPAEAALRRFKSNTNEGRLAEITAFVLDNGRLPSSKIKTESALYQQLYKLKKELGADWQAQLFPEALAVLENAERFSAEARRITEFSEFIERHGRLPLAKNDAENPIFQRLLRFRSHHGEGWIQLLSPEAQSVLSRLTPRKQTEEARLADLSELIVREGRLPNARAPGERAIYYWLNEFRKERGPEWKDELTPEARAALAQPRRQGTEWGALKEASQSQLPGLSEFIVRNGRLPHEGIARDELLYRRMKTAMNQFGVDWVNLLSPTAHKIVTELRNE